MIGREMVLGTLPDEDVCRAFAALCFVVAGVMFAWVAWSWVRSRRG